MFLVSSLGSMRSSKIASDGPWHNPKTNTFFYGDALKHLFNVLFRSLLIVPRTVHPDALWLWSLVELCIPAAWWWRLWRTIPLTYNRGTGEFRCSWRCSFLTYLLVAFTPGPLFHFSPFSCATLTFSVAFWSTSCYRVGNKYSLLKNSATSCLLCLKINIKEFTGIIYYFLFAYFPCHDVLRI